MHTTERLTSEVIREVLGPDVRTSAWNGQVMPYDAVKARWISAAMTRNYWAKAHMSKTVYHERYRGYCPQCERGDA